MKKRKLSTKKIRRLLLLLILIVVVIFVCFWGFTKLTGDKEAAAVKVVDNIKAYGYSLDDNETAYYKGLFTELKKELNKKEVDDEKYSSLLTQLFLSDFYNLENKITKNDIGGTQFVYKAYQQDFLKYATEGMYKYVENNTYDNRKQDLPVVKSITIVDVSKISYDYLEKTDESAYTVEAKIEYEVDLGYQTTATLTLVHQDNKLEIAKLKK